jgi:hypothetical protein
MVVVPAGGQEGSLMAYPLYHLQTKQARVKVNRPI